MSWISEQQHDYLKRLSGLNMMPEFQLRVSGNLSPVDPRPTKWIPWDEWNWDCRADFYTILPNEVVFDIDANIYSKCDHCGLLIESSKFLIKAPLYYMCPHCENFTHIIKRNITYESIGLAKKVHARLKQLRIPFYLYASGGKGLHFEIFLKCHNELKNVDWKRIRSEFAEQVLAGINYIVDQEKDKWAVDKTKWVWDEYRTKGSLLRLVGGKKVGYKTPLSKVPNYPVFATAPDFPGWIQSHYVNPVERKSKPMSQKYDRSKPMARNLAKLDFCVMSMVDQIKAGNHLSHLQNLAVGARCLCAGYSRQDIHEIYSHDPKYLATETEHQIDSILSMLEEGESKVVSCHTIQERGWCPSESMCKEFRRRDRNSN
jgi:hypothetical protein